MNFRFGADFNVDRAGSCLPALWADAADSEAVRATESSQWPCIFLLQTQHNSLLERIYSRLIAVKCSTGWMAVSNNQSNCKLQDGVVTDHSSAAYGRQPVQSRCDARCSDPSQSI